jgi:aspartate/methionine/tyrosine aminotransferase
MKIRSFDLERYFALYEFSAEYLLSSSDCEALSMKELIEMASPGTRVLWEELRLGYTESAGHPLLREKICSLYENMGPDNVLVTVPEEGIFIAMNALLDQGDHIVCISPAYQSLYEIARSIGCSVTPWEKEIRDGKWHFDTNKLEQAITEKTKMIIVNFPHNPTGWLPSPAEQKKIVSIASERGIYLFSDEMYRGLETGNREMLPGACDLYRNAISLSGLSKTYGLPGLRTGWLVCENPDIRKRLASFKDYTTICHSAPSEILSIMALENASRLASRSLEIVEENLGHARTFFDSYKDLFTWMEPAGGSIAYPRLDLDVDVFDFCEGAVKEKNVMVVPSKVLGDDSRHFRIGLGRKNFPEALEAFEEYVKELRVT